jgi:hypothetical protein
MAIQISNQMMNKYLLLLFTIILGQQTWAQLNPRTIKANSVKIAIKDGLEGKTRYWNHLIKSNTPIIYHLAKNNSTRQVTFYTDIDSISFTVNPESNYQFNVEINKLETCNVVLTTKNFEYTNIDNLKSEIDTIPFTLNRNKQIIIKGSINHSTPMDFCFDLGARMVYVIGKGFDKPNKLDINGLMEDESVTGLSTERTSSINTLQLGHLNFSNIPICYIDEAGFLENGGGLVGFNTFQNSVLEIDFDNKLLLIHNKLPRKSKMYSQLEFKQTTGGLYIPIIISNGKKDCKGWYFFDTGADNALTFDSKFAKREKLNNSMKILEKTGIASSEKRVIDAVIVEVPEVRIANFKLENVPTLLPNESNAEAEFEDGVIGIGLQSRFNFIIDYPNSKMYLKPSKHFASSFKERSNTSTLIIGILSGMGLIFIAWYTYKMTRQKIT